MFDFLQVVLDDLLPATDVRQWDLDGFVEATWPFDCGVEGLLEVGGADDDDVVGLFEAVHLSEELVEGAADEAGGHGVAAACQRVDLVDEDYAGGVLAGFLKQLTDALGA